MSLFLGIDPGIETTGFGVVRQDTGADFELLEYGVIRTTRDRTPAERLLMLQQDLTTVLQRHPGLTAVGVEELFFSKNAKTALQVAQARGVILCTLAQFGCIIHEVKPVQVKAALTGDGRASKTAMQKMVQLTFGLSAPPQPDDAADAIAVAMTAAWMHRHNSFL